MFFNMFVPLRMDPAAPGGSAGGGGMGLMMTRISLTAALFVCSWGVSVSQTRVDLQNQGRNVDFSNATTTRPIKTGTAIPSTCNVGELFFKTDSPAGSNLLACTSANTWSLQAGGSASLPSSTGNANRALFTDGTVPAWRTISAGGSGALQLTPTATDLGIDIVSAVVPVKAAANTFTGINTFDQGVQLTPQTAPGSPANGRIWYDTTASRFRVRENGVTADLRNPTMGMFLSAPAAGVTASSTQFFAPSGASFSGTESARQVAIPTAGTLRDLVVRTSSAQPSTGSLVCVLRVNGVSSLLSVTAAANAAAGTFSDLTDTVTLAALDLVSISCANAATSTSATVSGISFRMVQ